MTTLTLPKLYSAEEVAEISGRTLKAIYGLRAKRKRGIAVGPKFRTVDRRLFVAEDDLVTWLSGVDEEVEQ